RRRAQGARPRPRSRQRDRAEDHGRGAQEAGAVAQLGAAVLTPAKRRALAAAVTALLAVALAAAVAGRGCSSEDDTPEGAVRAFVAAARAGDHEALFELLGPATRARLERSAVHLGILTGEG